MEQNYPEPGSWATTPAHQLEIGDEIWFSGGWQLITASGRSGPVQAIYFSNGGAVNFPTNVDVMIKEK